MSLLVIFGVLYVSFSILCYLTGALNALFLGTLYLLTYFVLIIINLQYQNWPNLYNLEPYESPGIYYHKIRKYKIILNCLALFIIFSQTKYIVYFEFILPYLRHGEILGFLPIIYDCPFVSL
jgi:hypothetical protein